MNVVTAGMQPYFFPYLGYFDLIYNADVWVVFDTPQYIREGWVNRNRILHPQGGWKYLTVPVKKNALATPITEIKIDESKDWRGKMLRSMQHYREQAPFYRSFYPLLEECFSFPTNSLSILNTHILQRVCDFLEVEFDPVIFSQSNLELGPVEKPSDWAREITKAVNATILLNPPGGRRIYEPEEFRRHGIDLVIREFPPMTYDTGPFGFEPNLSIIDVLMWNSPRAVRDHLEAVRFDRNSVNTMYMSTASGMV